MPANLIELNQHCAEEQAESVLLELSVLEIASVLSVLFQTAHFIDNH